MILRRSTTRTWAARLRSGVTSSVVAAGAAEAACIVLTASLPTHVACAIAGTYVGGDIIAALKRAGADDACLRVHFQVPGVHHTWRPMATSSYTGTDCAP